MLKKIIVLAMVSALLSYAYAVPMPERGNWQTTLQGRDLDGDLSNGYEAFYDTALNITWLNQKTHSSNMSWYDAMEWAQSLVVYGISGWRLPRLMGDQIQACFYNSGMGGTNCGYDTDPASSELSHLFHVTLGGKPFNQTTIIGLENSGPFALLNEYSYWMESNDGTSVNFAWYSEMKYGSQYPINKLFLQRVWAVRDGDVASVPEPSTPILFSLGIVGVVLLRFRRALSV